ncbi:MAG: hypothetical protein SGPRY_007917 [Prymnesium sp.]
MRVFSEPTSHVLDYMSSHLKLLCHRDGPHCGGALEDVRTPVAAVHVRRGDSCDRQAFTHFPLAPPLGVTVPSPHLSTSLPPRLIRERSEPGPFNSMFAWDEKKQKLDRVGFRYCYTWGVYLDQLKKLQRMRVAPE